MGVCVGGVVSHQVGLGLRLRPTMRINKRCGAHCRCVRDQLRFVGPRFGSGPRIFYLQDFCLQASCV